MLSAPAGSCPAARRSRCKPPASSNRAPARSVSKLIEAARALQLEWRFGKKGVLGIWLTLAPYGGNLEGVQAGARAWFGTSAAAPRPGPSSPPRRASAPSLNRSGPTVTPPVPKPSATASSPKPTGMPPIPISPPSLPPSCRASDRRPAGRTCHAPLSICRCRTASSAWSPPNSKTLPAHDRPWRSSSPTPAPAKSALPSPSEPSDRGEGRGTRPLPRRPLAGFRAEAVPLRACVSSDGLARPETPLLDLPRHFGGYAPENYSRGHAGQHLRRRGASPLAQPARSRRCSTAWGRSVLRRMAPPGSRRPAAPTAGRRPRRCRWRSAAPD